MLTDTTNRTLFRFKGKIIFWIQENRYSWLLLTLILPVMVLKDYLKLIIERVQKIEE